MPDILNEAIKMIINQSQNIFETDLINGEQHNALLNFEFSNQDINSIDELENIKVISIPFDDLIKRKIVDDLISKLYLLKSKGMLKSIIHSIRIVDNNKIFIFVLLTEKFEKESMETINYMLYDDEIIDPDDQDWI